MEIVLVIVGGVLAVAGSLAAERYRANRDFLQFRWQRRYDCYVDTLAYTNELLTWARNQTSNPDHSDAPELPNLHPIAASVVLVGSKRVQDAWGNLDRAFSQFSMRRTAAASALIQAANEGSVDSADAIRLRMLLDDVVTEAFICQKALADSMAEDLEHRSLRRSN